MKDNKGYEIYETRELAEAARQDGEITALRTGNNRPEGTGWGYYACIPEAEACSGDIIHFHKLQTTEIGLDEEPEAAPETMRYGEVVAALRAAKDLEAEAESWMNIARLSAGHPLFAERQKEYQNAAQRAITARLEWLDVRNDFESGK